MAEYDGHGGWQNPHDALHTSQASSSPDSRNRDSYFSAKETINTMESAVEVKQESPPLPVKQERLSPTPQPAGLGSPQPGSDRSASIQILQAPPEGSRRNKVDEDHEIIEILDNRGDLVIVAGEANRRRFQVCSRTFFRAAPAFESEYRDQLEARIPKQIHVPRLNPAALHVLLLLTHNQTKQVFPMLSDRSLLAEALVIASNFDMHECLSPVASKWWARVWDKDAIRHDDLGPLLWIATQLGHYKCLRRIVGRLITNSRLNKKGELIGFGASDDEPYLNYRPLSAQNNLIESLTNCRKLVIDTLLKVNDEAIQRLMTAPTNPFVAIDGEPNPTVCQSLNNPIRCDCSMLGALIRSLTAGGWAWTVVDNEMRLRPPADELRGSPKRLYEKLKGMGQTAVDMAHGKATHSLCEPYGGNWVALDDMINQAFEGVGFDRAKFLKRASAYGFENMEAW